MSVREKGIVGKQRGRRGKEEWERGIVGKQRARRSEVVKTVKDMFLSLHSFLLHTLQLLQR